MSAKKKRVSALAPPSDSTTGTAISSKTDKDIQETIKEAKRRRSPSEQSRVKATYDLPETLIEEIRTVATDLGVPMYAVARKFLEYGCRAYRSGELELKRKEVATRYDLE